MIHLPPPAEPSRRIHPEHFAIAAIVALAGLGGVAAWFDVSVWATLATTVTGTR